MGGLIPQDARGPASWMLRHRARWLGLTVPTAWWRRRVSTVLQPSETITQRLEVHEPIDSGQSLRRGVLASSAPTPRRSWQGSLC